MNIAERINCLVALGDFIRAQSPELETAVRKTAHANNWLTEENCRLALKAIADEFLSRQALEAWTAQYPLLHEARERRSIGLVMAGNLPLVGFHDVLCCFVAGHKSLIKLSDKDPFILPVLLDAMAANSSEARDYFELLQQLKGYDAVIATGSNNTARYFEYYFGKVPHIIRHNRYSVAVLTGTESEEELRGLAGDVFRYFGMGCRNVSRIFVPEGYDLGKLMEHLNVYANMALHDKYRGNYDYNLTLMMMNRVKYYVNDCVMLTDNDAYAGRIACLHYTEYEGDASAIIARQQDLQNDNIQCVVCTQEGRGLTAFGKTQQPSLTDYADHIDSMAFLCNL